MYDIEALHRLDCRSRSTTGHERMGRGWPGRRRDGAPLPFERSPGLLLKAVALFRLERRDAYVWLACPSLQTQLMRLAISQEALGGLAAMLSEGVASAYEAAGWLVEEHAVPAAYAISLLESRFDHDVIDC